jgi:hypothetical protein
MRCLQKAQQRFNHVNLTLEKRVSKPRLLAEPSGNGTRFNCEYTGEEMGLPEPRIK